MQQARVIVIPLDKITINQVSDAFPDVSATTQMITPREHEQVLPGGLCAIALRLCLE
jgi:hypothetical protein